MSEVWVRWHKRSKIRYRFVEKECSPDFGEIWYNQSSDAIFVRKVTHEFEYNTAQVLENKEMPNCVYLGEL